MEYMNNKIHSEGSAVRFKRYAIDLRKKDLKIDSKVISQLMAINRLEKPDLEALYYAIFSGKFDEKTSLWEA